MAALRNGGPRNGKPIPIQDSRCHKTRLGYWQNHITGFMAEFTSLTASTFVMSISVNACTHRNWFQHVAVPSGAGYHSSDRLKLQSSSARIAPSSRHSSYVDRMTLLDVCPVAGLERHWARRQCQSDRVHYSHSEWTRRTRYRNCCMYSHWYRWACFMDVHYTIVQVRLQWTVEHIQNTADSKCRVKRQQNWTDVEN